MHWFRTIWTQIWITLVTMAVLVALYTSLGRQLIPLVETYRTDIVKALEEITGTNVSIQSVIGAWDFLSPKVTIYGVNIGGVSSLSEKTGRSSPVRIDKIDANLDVSATLFYRRPIFSHIIIDGVSGHIHKRKDNSFWISDHILITDSNKSEPRISQPRSNASTSSNEKKHRLLRWLERQHEIRITNWTLQYTDLSTDLNSDSNTNRSDTQTLSISDISIRNRGSQRLIEGQAFLGTDQPSELYINAEIKGPIWPWEAQQGDVYLRFSPNQWASFFPASLLKEIQINSAKMAAEGWLTVKDGDLHRLLFNLTVDEFDLVSGGEPLTLGSGNIQVAGGYHNDDWHLRLTPTFKQQLPIDWIDISTVNLEAGKGFFIELPPTQIQPLINYLTTYKWVPDRLAEYLSSINIQGKASAAQLQWIPSIDLALDIRLVVEEITTQAFKGIPALNQASGIIRLQPNIGEAIITDEQLDLHLQDLYDTSWSLNDVEGRYRWSISSEAVHMQLDRFNVSLDGTDISGRLGIRIPKKESSLEPHLAIQLGIENGPLLLQQKLVPDSLDKGLTQWLNSALLGGQLTNIGFILNGLPGETSPDNALSSLMRSQFNSGTVRYQEGWPIVDNLEGDFFMDVPNIDLMIDSGKTLGGSIAAGTSVSIRPSKYGTSVTTQVSISGSGKEALGYLQNTPLSDELGAAFSDWELDGSHSTTATISIPLLNDEAQVGIDLGRLNENIGLPQINLTSNLSDVDLTLTELDIDMEDISGQFTYSTQKGIRSNRLTGRIFDGPFSTKIYSKIRKEGLDIVLDGKGDASWNAVNQWLNLFFMEPVQGRISYQSDIKISTVDPVGVRLNVQSNLVNTTIDLPPPYLKEKDKNTPLNLVVEVGESTDISINYNNQLRSIIRLIEGEVLTGDVTLDGSTPTLSATYGINVRGVIDDEVHLDPWWDIWDRMMALSQQYDQELIENDNTSNDNVSDGNIVKNIDLLLKNLDVYGVNVEDTRVIGSENKNKWNIQFSNAITKGLAIIPLEDIPIILNLDYIHWNSQLVEVSKTISFSSTDSQLSVYQEGPRREHYLFNDPLNEVYPNTISSLDVTLQELYLDTRNIGRWQFSIRPTTKGLVAKILDADLRGLNVNGELYWERDQGLHSTRLTNFKLSSNNIGNVQQAFRLDRVLEAKQFDSDININWLGSPFAIDTDYLDALDGNINIKAEKGEFNAEGAGALNAFGVLNFNTVARRLRLDFSDLAASGFSYDKLRGFAEIKKGIFNWEKPLSIEGPGGKFLTSGEANLRDGALNMKLAVTFPITGSLPMVAVIAGFAPPVAGAIYVTEKLIGDELERFTSASYDISGTINAPVMTINQAFDNKVDGKKSKSFKDRVLSIFGIDDD